MAREPARPEQVEEDRAAAEERLEVATELRWIEPPERRQQLTLAAGPFQEGANRGRGLRSNRRRWNGQAPGRF